MLRTLSLLSISLFTACVSVHPPAGDIPPAAGETRGVTLPGSDLIVIGDQGSGSQIQYDVGRGIELFCKSPNRTCDVGMTVGDNFYPSGVKSTNDKLWTTALETPYKGLPLGFKFYPSLGNHDYGGSWESQVAYKSARWSMPNRFYRLNTPAADIFAIDTEHFDKAQQTWLQEGLKSSTKPWQVVYGHRPVYSSGAHGDSIELKTLLLPLLVKYGVEFYVSGHDHHLEAIERDGFVQLISGAAGKLRSVKGGKYSTFAGSVPGFLYMDFSDSAVDVTFVNAAARPLYTKKYLRKG